MKRADDKEDVMKKRIATFESSIPIFEKYKEANCLKKIDANGGLEEIFTTVENTFLDSGLIQKCDKPKPTVVFVMGGPGAGKGTQCGRLLKKYPELDSYSTGDLLRAKVKEDSEEARALKADMAKGNLVSSETVVGLMKDYMNKSSKNIFLADGFPRSQENLDVWMKVIGDSAQVKFLLLFDLDGEEMLKRLMYRASQSEVMRDDDKEDVMKKRIHTFEKSLPIFE